MDERRLSEVDSDDILTFDRITRDFNGIAVVKEISLALRRGEILTLLGASGCGKTTTLRMAIGLERCAAGKIVCDGRVLDAPAEGHFVPPEARDMGMAFQSYAIWPHLSVFENVAFPLRARGMDKPSIAAKVADVLALVGLAGFEQRSGMQLSGGQQQRVAIARALSFEPKVLLMDEPFSNLDARLREQMRIDLRLLQQRLGLSILFVTHDQSEALALSDRIAIIADGRVEQIGKPDDIYAHPETMFVRDFIGRWIALEGVVEALDQTELTVVLEDGSRILAAGPRHGDDLATGAQVLLTIRPEDIAAGAAARAEGTSGNVVTSTVRTLLFRGDHYEAVVDLASGQRLTIPLARSGGWAVGQSVQLGLDAQHIHCWAAA